MDVIKDETPKEKEGSIKDYIDKLNKESSGDIVEDIYGNFEYPEYPNDEPSEQISPKVNWEEQGWHGNILFFFIYLSRLYIGILI